MLLVDVLIRYSAVALLLWVAVLALRDGRGFVTSRFAILVCISIAAMLLSTAPPELHLPRIPHIVIRLMDMPNIVFIWWLGLSMFQDGFKLKLWHWGVFAIYSGSILIYRLMEFGVSIDLPIWFDVFVDIVTFAMMAHLAFIALKGRADDLIEPRRRLRLFFVLALVAGTVLSVVAENLFMENFGAALTMFRAAVVLPLTIWALLWVTKYQPEKLSFQKQRPLAAKPTGLDPRDDDLHKKLIAEMQDQKTYLEPNLSIRALAERLKTPEHRLRVLINQGMGHRNFSGFLNAYRIEAVKQAFEDPENTRIPVLTIAMDAGYGSLAPFNRAFLKATGMTPSAYRQELLVKSNQK